MTEDRTNPLDAADTKRILARLFDTEDTDDATPAETPEDETPEPEPAPPIGGTPPTRRMVAPPPERTL